MDDPNFNEATEAGDRMERNAEVAAMTEVWNARHRAVSPEAAPRCPPHHFVLKDDGEERCRYCDRSINALALAEAAPPRATTPTENPECTHCGAYRCHHFGRAEYCNPTCLDRGAGSTFAISLAPSRESGALLDDPELDATDGAHPAWWRGNDRGVDSACERIADILDEKSKPPYHFGSAKLSELAARIASLERDAARMREDSARLDWMDENSAGVEVADNECGTLTVQSNEDYTVRASGDTIREAIDKARALAPSGEPTTTPDDGK